MVSGVSRVSQIHGFPIQFSIIVVTHLRSFTLSLTLLDVLKRGLPFPLCMRQGLPCLFIHHCVTPLTTCKHSHTEQKVFSTQCLRDLTNETVSEERWTEYCLSVCVCRISLREYLQPQHGRLKVYCNSLDAHFISFLSLPSWIPKFQYYNFPAPFLLKLPERSRVCISDECKFAN